MHRLCQHHIYLRVSDDFDISFGMLEHGVPNELWSADRVSRIQLLVAFFLQYLCVVGLHRLCVDYVIGTLGADYGKLIEGVIED